MLLSIFSFPCVCVRSIGCLDVWQKHVCCVINSSWRFTDKTRYLCKNNPPTLTLSPPPPCKSHLKCQDEFLQTIHTLLEAEQLKSLCFASDYGAPRLHSRLSPMCLFFLFVSLVFFYCAIGQCNDIYRQTEKMLLLIFNIILNGGFAQILAFSRDL